MKKAYVFDMDGTILSSVTYWFNFGNEVLKLNGINETIDPVRLEKFTLMEALDFLRVEFNIPKSLEDLEKDVFEHLYNKYRNEFEIKDGTLEILEYIRSKGGIIALATATERKYVNGFLEKYPEVAKYFELIETVEVDTFTKNDVEFFEGIAKKLNVKISDMYVIEDAPHSMETAKKAGCTVIAVLEDTMKPIRSDAVKFSDYHYEKLNEIEYGILGL